MRISDVAAKYNIDPDSFAVYLDMACGIKGDLPDSQVEEYVTKYKEFRLSRMTPEEKEKAAALQEQIEETKRLEAEYSKILISSGFNFEGYRIVKYSGYISGDDAIQIPRSGLFERSMNGQKLTDALVKIRRQALKELKEAAYNLGCNAVIGVDFDYITLEPQTASVLSGTTIYEPYVVCVTANGNAVIIEKNE